MQIIFNVLTIQGTPPFTPMTYMFDQSGGSVGRDQRADWVLLDDKKFLSGKHFKIHCDGKSFSIVDSSTNGTFLNDSILPLGIDSSQVLTEGDQIKIGEYVILVSSIEKSSVLEQVGNDDVNYLLTEASQPIQDPRDPFFSSAGHFSDSGASKKRLNTTIDQQKSSFVGRTEEGASESLLKDPFFSTGDESFSPDQDFSYDDHNEENIVHPSYPVDINTPISIKEASQTQESLKQGSIDTVKNSIEEEPDVFNFLDEKDQSTKVESSRDKHSIKDANLDVVDADNNVNDEEVIEELEEVDEKKKKTSPPITEAVVSSEAIEALLKGAGIAKRNLSSDVSAKTFETIGKALREVLQGTIDLLKSRSEIKNHLHLDRTIINSVENNPLKFMPTAQQVIIHLLTSEDDDKTYQNLDLALEEAFDDIKAHQLAMTAATEKALREVIKQHFSPTNLANNMAKTNPISAVIPVKRQAKLWNMFETLYEDVEEKATESFQRLLDHEISKAYEDQLLEIKTLRHKNQNEEFPE